MPRPAAHDLRPGAAIQAMSRAGMTAATAAVRLSPARPRRQVAIFGFGLILGQSLSAATTPLFTRALGPAGFGALDVLTVVATLLATLLLAGMDQAVVACFFADDAPAARQRLVGTGLTLVLITGVGGGLAGLALRQPMADLLFSGHRSDALMVAALLGVPPAIALAYATEVLRLAGRAAAYTISGVLRAIVGGALGLWLAVGAHQGVAGVLLGLAGGSLVGLAYDLAVAPNLLRPRLSRAAVRSMGAFGLPLVPAGIAFWSLMVIDRVVLVHNVPLRQVGYYALANKIALLMMWAVYGFRAGWTTSMLELHQRDPKAATTARALALGHVVGGASVLAALLGSLSIELVGLGGGSGFRPAARLIPLLLAAFVVFSSTVVVQSAMVAQRRSGPVACHTLGAAAVNIAGCLILVPTWGAAGAAAATLLGFGYLAVGLFVSAQRMDPVPYRVGLAVAAGALSLPYLLLGQISIGPLVVSIAVKMACVALLPVVLCRLGVLPVPPRLPAGLARRIAPGRHW